MDIILLTRDYIEDTLNSGDEKMIQYFMVQSKILPIGISLLYIFVMTVLGPYFMKNRGPLNIRFIMFAYDVITVAINATLFIKVISLTSVHGLSFLCKDDSDVEDEILKRYCRDIIWTMYITKYVDMLDTLFLVLRKQSERISKLHIYHHTTVPLLFWFALRTEKQVHLVVYGTLNAFIHSVMYSYYALCSLGPSFRPILKYKKYITLLQIVQFLFILPYFVIIVMTGCARYKTSIVFFTMHTSLLLYMFVDYYIRSYTKIVKKASGGNGVTHNVINDSDDLRDTIDIYKRE